MNKTVIRIFTCFTGCAVLIAMILLVINFFAFAVTASDSANLYNASPRKTLDCVTEGLVRQESGYMLEQPELIPQGVWCILIDEGGSVVWSQNMPGDIPARYTVQDVALMSRWYLRDYPVYIRNRQDGLLVLGYPKNSVGKYSIEYSMDWFRTLPWRAMGVLLFNICLAAVLACILGTGLYRRLKMLTGGISALRQERTVILREKGIFRELARNINETSKTIRRKNMLLQQRDSARSNWIAGISHDIRTPLSLILGYAEEILEDNALPAGRGQKAEKIIGQCLKIKRLVEDLNLISSLEYDMQPARKKSIRICTLLRETVSDIYNSGLSQSYTVTLDLQWEKAVVSGDDSLIRRAVFNIIHNSIVHNPGGCNITVAEYRLDSVVCIHIYDNGTGVSERVLDSIYSIPKSAHGLGLPMAYKIVTAHGGEFKAWNDLGFHVRIELPVIED